MSGPRYTNTTNRVQRRNSDRRNCNSERDTNPPLLDSQEVRDKLPNNPHPYTTNVARQWDNSPYHQALGLPHPPTATNAGANVAVHVHGARPKEPTRHHENRYQASRQHEDYDNNGQNVRTRRDQRLQKLKENTTQRGLRGAPEPDIVYLYITNCDIETTAEELELHILQNYEKVNEVRARDTARSHSYYASFTVVVKGEDLDTGDFLYSDVFPKPIRVFLNRNKYLDQEDV